MPTADYKCDECGWVSEFMFGGTPPPTHTAKHWDLRPHCEDPDSHCPGTLHRKYTPVAIGQVPGAGGSPARTSL